MTTRRLTAATLAATRTATASITQPAAAQQPPNTRSPIAPMAQAGGEADGVEGVALVPAGDPWAVLRSPVSCDEDCPERGGTFGTMLPVNRPASRSVRTFRVLRLALGLAWPLIAVTTAVRAAAAEAANVVFDQWSALRFSDSGAD